MLVVGILTYALVEPWLPGRMRMLVAWNASTLAYLGLAWLTVAKANPEMTRVRAENQDQSGYVIFLLVVSAAGVSFVAIGFLSAGIKDLPFWPRAGHLTLSVVALLLSWLMIQTLFGFHYARGYYSRQPGTKELRRGLKFPGDKEPDYLDFAYYSFVVGMTSQVSDVTVLTRHMRRLTLIHGVLSFIFNIAILAMSINIIGGAI